ncbi:PAS domain-containing protein [Undibacterium sp. CY7W]|uniref:histidine kinase n=1 Tax=Undibacterium rugosum TaxID=2762291 RepID=A0A923IB40_9BURK|nr:ATP-binding protein [Undibacterium rugosum]MBC3935955.1 PAS domain-containing protein [Undibacterium rugosum]
MENQFEYFDLSVPTPAASTPASAAQAANVSQEVAQHNRLKYLIDNTPAIIYSSVPTGDFKMTYVSSNAQRILGYDSAMMVSDPNFWFDHIHPDDVPQIFSSLAMLFSEGERTYEYRFKNSSGHYIWMHDMLRLIRDEAGNPIEVVGSLTDISERKAMEESLQKKGEEQKQLIHKLQEAQDQLMQSEKMASVGQLAAGIAHEINNPIGFVNSNMGSLQGYVEKLFEVLAQYEQLILQPQAAQSAVARVNAIKKEADLEFLQEDVEDLVRESMDGLKRVRDIVQSLKDFSHVGETDWQEADIHHGIDSTLNIVINEIKYKATVIKEYGTLPNVRCIISQINQVVMNLLVNASHAIKDKGTITINTGCKDDWIWIRISDTGSGIPPEIMTRIFEPFFTTKPVGSGTGLGLSLSYGIIKKHNGRIEVKSEMGVGTSFTIHLPLRPDKVDAG